MRDQSWEKERSHIAPAKSLISQVLLGPAAMQRDITSHPLAEKTYAKSFAYRSLSANTVGIRIRNATRLGILAKTGGTTVIKNCAFARGK
jgi:hypothetical protein